MEGSELAEGWDMAFKRALAMPDKTIVQAGMRPIPQSVQRWLYERALRTIPWEKIGEKVVRPTINEVSKGAEVLKDSANSYMYRSTHPSDRLIDEAIANHLRKFGK
jgi:hypothetical protein